MILLYDKMNRFFPSPLSRSFLMRSKHCIRCTFWMLIKLILPFYRFWTKRKIDGWENSWKMISYIVSLCNWKKKRMKCRSFVQKESFFSLLLRLLPLYHYIAVRLYFELRRVFFRQIAFLPGIFDINRIICEYSFKKKVNETFWHFGGTRIQSWNVIRVILLNFLSNRRFYSKVSFSNTKYLLVMA